MKKYTTIAAAVATMLIAGGAVLAGEGVEVEQTDPYGNDNWTAQGPLQLGSDVEQDDPYGNENWTAQGPLQLTNRQRHGREAVRLVRLCNSRMIRMVFEVRGIELTCP